MKTKFFSLLLVLISVFAMADTKATLSGDCGRKINVNADSTNLQWSLDLSTHTLTITGSGRMKDYDNDTKAPWYSQRNEIHTVNFPDGMTTVGNYAMYQHSNLATINWGGNTVITIGNYAFYSCQSLTTLVLPTSVQQIGECAFIYCYGLKSIKMGNQVQRVAVNAFYNCNHITEIDMGESPAEIDAYAFYNNSALVTLNINKVKSISYNAFDNCVALKSLHLPATLTNMYGSSFCSCSGLDTITVHPDNAVYDSRDSCNAVIRTADNALVLGCCKTVIPNELKSIDGEAFYGCNRLNAIVLPDSLQSIGSYAFYLCSQLDSVIFPKGLQSIGAYAFQYCSQLTSIVLPEGMQSIGTYAFYSCSQLSSVNFPESITNVGCSVFQNCNNLTTPVYNSTIFVCMPTSYEGAYSMAETTKQIACGAFCDCSKITSIAIPSSVSGIGSSAFYNCSSLTQIALPERLKSINNYLFYSCSSLPSIIIPDSVTTISDNAFGYCRSLTSISFPANLTYIGGEVLRGCSNLRSIFWNVRTYSAIPKDKAWNDPLYYNRSQVTDFTFGDSVQMIPDNLCYDMTQLTSLSLGCNITSIGTAFDGCTNIKSVHWNLRSCNEPDVYTRAPFYALRDSITTFSFGDSVQMIPNYLCHSMKKLQQLYIPENVSTIGAFTFRYVEALDSISVHENNIHYDSRNGCNALIESSSNKLLLGCYKTNIPEDITSIGECAFRNVRNLRSVVLSDNVTTIGKEAFNGCKEMVELVLPEELEKIDDYTFQDCDSLLSLTLPASVNTIGLRAFANCSHLESVNCKAATPPTIDGTSFSRTTCSFYVPCANIANYRSASVWSDFGNRIVGEALYTLTVKPNEYAYGVVTVLQQPDCERTAIVEAEPSRGYEFVAWQDEYGKELSTESHYEFALEEDLNLIAIFQRIGQGIENVWEEGQAVWYDLMGHRIDEPTHGVYIVQIGNDTRKVVIP